MTQDPNAAWADGAIAELDALMATGVSSSNAHSQRVAQGTAEAFRAGGEPWADSAMAEMERYAQDPSVLERGGTIGGGVASGALQAGKSIFSDLPNTLANTLGGAVGLRSVEQSEADSDRSWKPSTFIRDLFETPIEKLTPAKLREQDSAAWRYSQLGGTMVPLLAAGWALGPTEIAAVGAAQQAGQSGKDAADAGAGKLATLGATLQGAALGGVGAKLLEGVLTRINTTAGNAIVQAVVHDARTLPEATRAAIAGATATGVRAAEGTVAGAGAGVAYTALVNGIHNFATDEDIPILLGANENAAFGAALGGMIRGATEAALQRRRFTGRKFTAAGGEGPLLDMSGMSEGEALPEQLTKTPAEFVDSPWEDPAARAQVAEQLGAEQAAKPVPDEVEYTPRGSPDSFNPLARREGPRPGEQLRWNEVEPGMRSPAADEYTPRGDPKSYDPNLRREAPRPEFIEPGMRAPDEGYTVKGDRKAFESRPKIDPLKPQPRDYAGAVEHGLRPPPTPDNMAARYQSAEAPTLTRADYHPVVDKASGREIVNIGGRLRGTLEDTIHAPRVMGRQEVVTGVHEAAKLLVPELALRQGGVGPGGLGVYSEATHTARIAKYGDMSTAAHEVAHAIEDRVLGTTDSPFTDAKLREPVMAELTRLGKLANPGEHIPPNGYLSEGWAEFVRVWAMQHEDLMHFAPETTRWFDGTLLKKHPEFAAALDRARGSADVWRFQGAHKRIEGTIAQPPTQAQKARALISGLTSTANFMRDYVSSIDALRRYEDGKAKLGKPSPKLRRLDDMAEMLGGMADQTAAVFVKDHTVSLWGEKNGESLEAAAAHMKGHAPELEAYFKAKRALWLLTEREGWDASKEEWVAAPHDKGVAELDARYAIEALETKFPQIEDTANRVLGWYERALDYVVECDPGFALVREAMRQDGEFYVPQHTEYEGGRRSGNAIKSDARNLRLGEKLQAGGSARPTKPVLTQFQTEVASLFRRAHERMLINALVTEGRDAGLGALFEDLTETLHGTGEGYTIGQEVDAASAPEATLHAFFSQPTLDASNRAVFKYVEALPTIEGMRRQVRAIALHPDVYEALVGMNPNEMRVAMGWLGNLGRKTRNAQIAGHIVVNPAWTLFKNVAFDLETAYLNTRYSHAFRDLVLDWVPNLVRTAAYEFTNGKLPYEWVDVYRNMRANVSAKFESENVATHRARDIMATNGKRVRQTLTSWDDLYELAGRMMGVSDEAPRIWELRRAAKQVGWKPGESIAPEQFMEMSLAAKRITGNRSLGGTKANRINLSVAFFRSAFVNPRDTMRAAASNKLRFAMKAASLSAMAAYYWHLTHDDEGIDSQDADERFNRVTLPMGKDDQGRDMAPVSIPLAPEAALFWKSTEFALDAMFKQEPLKALDLTGAFIKTYSPPFMPAGADEALLQFANRRSMGSSGTIDEPGVLPEEQFDDGTAKLAVMVGHTSGISPRRIEHAIRSIFGAPGEFALDGFGLPLDKKNQDTTARSVLEGTWLRRGGNVSTRSRWVDQAFRLTALAEMRARSRFEKETPEQAMLRQTLANTTRATAAAYAIAKTYAMSPDERQSYYKFANDLARKTVQDVTNSKLDPGRAYAARLRMENEKRIKQFQAGGQQ